MYMHTKVIFLPKTQFKRLIYLFVALSTGLISCQDSKNKIEVTVTNQLDFDRSEVVSIDRNELSSVLDEHAEENLSIRKKGSEEYLLIQWIDYNQDGISDELLFQANVAANAKVQYELFLDRAKVVPESDVVAYSRFVPERTDDYTWENDKVAFRTYGPEAQRLVEENEPGGTLSSGIDLWLKRVSYSVIDKWYAENDKDPGYYHIDHGEGYDPYHVGKSRGTGGVGIWTGDSLLVSQNFTDYKIIAEGPIRTVFELSYAPWSDYQIKETKRISLDIGSNFSRFQILFDPEKEVPNYTLGITLHENEGEIKIKNDEGWFRHWERIDDAGLGEGIIIDPAVVDTAFVHLSKIPDQSQLFVITNPKDNVLHYYAGFGWEKSGQVKSVVDWDRMLQRQMQIIANPLKVSIK